MLQTLNEFRVVTVGMRRHPNLASEVAETGDRVVFRPQAAVSAPRPAHLQAVLGVKAPRLGRGVVGAGYEYEFPLRVVLEPLRVGVGV